ncbi:MAG: hypothetical protein K9W45_11440 [Candidatus Heimdallarchaeum aukensis]|uniref:Uncharacterized protein n=1 Tax=Candidatus Heimdallarchaeum aukensis TaxID=2876573 RepID=A0A9Y1BKH6_9ARCH|nr:MAG: hypothetical protein K9W45_11440 [Candidatus Heimdallarchaeum aukensis]
MFIAVSFASLMSTILFEAGKFLGGKAAGDFLYKRIKKKLQKNKIDVDQEGISEKGLELFRNVLQEELQAFGIKQKEIDFLIIKSVQKLSDEHGMILEKMETIESLLVELTTGLLYDAHVGLSDVPVEVGEKLFERFISGDKKAEEKIEEYIEDEHFSSYLKKSMKKYKPIQKAYQHEELLVKRFLRHFKGEKGDIDQLALFSELWALIGAKNLETNKILESIVFKLLKEIAETKEIGLSNLLKFLHLLDLADSLTKLDFDTRSQIILFLKVNLEEVSYYTKMEIAYFLMKFSINEPEVMESVSVALEELSKQKYSDKFVEESVSLSKRIIRFFRRNAKVDVERSLKVINSLSKRFEKRKFSRSTSLLEGQLTRTLAETNLLAVKIVDEYNYPEEELRRTVIRLINSLIKAKDKEELSSEHRLRIWQIIDNCIFILNRIAIRNTKKILDNWELNLAKKYGLYSKDWGLYKRKTDDELEKVVKNIRLNEAFIKKVELEKKLSKIEELPEPPIKEKKLPTDEKEVE